MEINDLFRANAAGRERETFEHAMRLAFCGSQTVGSYELHPTEGLVMYGPKEIKGALALPFKMKVDAAIEFIWAWWESLAKANVGTEDHKIWLSYAKDGYSGDGHNYHGWSLTTNPDVSSKYNAVVGVKPAWAYVGK